MLPPSTNNLFVDRRDGKGRAKSTAYARWAYDAGWLVKQQIGAIMTVHGRVAVLIEAPMSRRRDLDNMKPILDLLSQSGETQNKTGLGLIDDDRWIDDLRIVRTTEGQDMMISIWSIA